MSNIIDIKLKDDWWGVQYCVATSFAIVENVDIVAFQIAREKNSDKIKIPWETSHKRRLRPAWTIRLYSFVILWILAIAVAYFPVLHNISNEKEDTESELLSNKRWALSSYHICV